MMMKKKKIEKRGNRKRKESEKAQMQEREREFSGRSTTSHILDLTILSIPYVFA